MSSMTRPTRRRSPLPTLHHPGFTRNGGGFGGGGNGKGGGGSGAHAATSATPPVVVVDDVYDLAKVVSRSCPAATQRLRSLGFPHRVVRASVAANERGVWSLRTSVPRPSTVGSGGGGGGGGGGGVPLSTDSSSTVGPNHPGWSQSPPATTAMASSLKGRWSLKGLRKSKSLIDTRRASASSSSSSSSSGSQQQQQQHLQQQLSQATPRRSRSGGTSHPACADAPTRTEALRAELERLRRTLNFNGDSSVGE
jgi:hypothetical protein